MRTPRRPISSTLAAASLMLSIAGSSPQAAAAPQKATQTFSELGPVKVGAQVPSWAGHTPTGQMIRSADILTPRRGPPPKALVISFFGTWCLPCRAGLRTIQSVMNETEGYKTVLIAKPPQLNKVRPFLKGLGVNQLVVNDTHEKIAGRLGVGKAVPRTIVVGPDGVVRAIFGEEGGDFKAVLKQAMTESNQAATP